jgi:hypothetical protein
MRARQIEQNAQIVRRVFPYARSISNLAPGAVSAAVASFNETLGQAGSRAITGSGAPFIDKDPLSSFGYAGLRLRDFATLELIRAALKAIESRNLK